jgi:uncharacterized cupin superfamily protein
MSPILIRVENENAFSAPAPVGAPTSEQIAEVRVAANQETPAGNAGIWECSPGRFRRQVAQAEYSYFISGEGSFTPDGGAPVVFRPGDSIYFAANTHGEWEIRETVRKAYLILT